MRSIVLATALLAPTVAVAQEPPFCAPLETLRKTLIGDFSERLVVEAELPNGTFLHIYAARNGSWTMLVVSPSGVACVGPVGTGFRSAEGRGI